jgi:hypothetical protein
MSKRDTVLGAVAMVILASSSAAQTPTVPVLTYDEYVDTLATEQVGEIVRRAARGGVLVPGLDYCEHLDEIALLRWYTGTAPEPIEGGCLDTLSQSSFGLLADEDRMFTAAILYRYGRPEGRTQLAEMLEEGNQTAAWILGVNHETEFLDGVLQVFRMQRNTRERELIHALGTWQQPPAVEVLLEVFKADRSNIDYGVALSLSGAGQAVPVIEDYFESARSDDVGKLDAAAALVRLGVNAAQHLSYLTEEMQSATPPFEAWPIYASNALGLAGGAQAEAALISRVSAYLSAATPTPGTGAVGGNLELEGAVGAARALRHFSSGAAASSVAALLQRIGTPSNQQGPSELEGELAALLLTIGDQEGINVTRQQLGDAWVDRAMTVRGLKLIPPRFLPRSSRRLLPGF